MTNEDLANALRVQMETCGFVGQPITDIDGNLLGHEILSRPLGIAPEDRGRAFAAYAELGYARRQLAKVFSRQITFATLNLEGFVSLNASPAALDWEAVRLLVNSVKTSRQIPHFQLELTEDAELTSYNLPMLGELKTAGVKIFLDDAGDGVYGDDAYVGWLLKHLRPDGIKLGYKIGNRLEQEAMQRRALRLIEIFSAPSDRPIEVIIEGSPEEPSAEWRKAASSLGHFAHLSYQHFVP